MVDISEFCFNPPLEQLADVPFLETHVWAPSCKTPREVLQHHRSYCRGLGDGQFGHDTPAWAKPSNATHRFIQTEVIVT